MKIFFLTFLFLTLGISAISQRSNFYKPLTKNEKILFEKAEKCIMPSDVRENPGPYLNKLIHWIGIVDTIMIKTNSDTIIADIYLQQRYWDYIEDFSIQKEKMFISPFGEGYFLFRKKFPISMSVDTLKKHMAVFANKENLIFAYGKFIGLQDSLPILGSEGIRVVIEENYATNIASYKIRREKNNSIICGEKGIPETTELKFLKIAGPGRNQMGSRLKNSQN
jgi:hypothetical protein